MPTFIIDDQQTAYLVRLLETEIECNGNKTADNLLLIFKPTTLSQYRREFPDFPVADWPTVIPDGFEDSSWHNDSCPSLHDATREITIMIDYADADVREHPDTTRYGATQGENGEFYTNDWNEMLQFIASLPKAGAA